MDGILRDPARCWARAATACLLRGQREAVCWQAARKGWIEASTALAEWGGQRSRWKRFRSWTALLPRNIIGLPQKFRRAPRKGVLR